LIEKGHLLNLGTLILDVNSKGLAFLPSSPHQLFLELLVLPLQPHAVDIFLLTPNIIPLVEPNNFAHHKLAFQTEGGLPTNGPAQGADREGEEDG